MSVKLKDLKPGDWFMVNGHKGRLIYANVCRARVWLGNKEVVIRTGTLDGNHEASFQKTIEQDWGPDTEVILIQGGEIHDESRPRNTVGAGKPIKSRPKRKGDAAGEEARKYLRQAERQKEEAARVLKVKRKKW